MNREIDRYARKTLREQFEDLWSWIVGHRLRTLMEAECLTAFPGYVGHPVSGSIFVTFAAAPTTAQLAAGTISEVCLVARADGQWMSSPARGSGQ